MELIRFIEEVGDEKAAALFKVKERTVKSWRLRERKPRPKQAERIVEHSPVTWEGIYGSN